ncbi:MAG: tetratricopeptide repeat protein [Chthoniobacterales bacterium]
MALLKRLLPVFMLIALAALLGFAISRQSPSPRRVASTAPVRVASSTPLQVVLTPLGGDEKIDHEIAKIQARIKASPDQVPAYLERLGWTFVEKARISSDPGYYKLAEQCADAIVQMKPGSPDGELLRGHIYHALHRFKDAERVARRLTAQRTFVFDYALLGDALMEQGRLDEAVVAYQKMVDLKPCLQTYSRVAHMRWLKGDLPGAIQAIRYAVTGGSIIEPEPVAWAYTKLSFYALQSGQTEVALRSTELATQYVPDYAAALLMRGRVQLAKGDIEDAVATLRRAADKNPLPEYLWTLADALRADNKSTEAAAVEQKLRSTGAANDPRTLSLFPATRDDKSDVALRLAKEELQTRQDIFTHDAVAWAEFAQGHLQSAESDMGMALSQGTKDGRLFYHAGMMAAAAGKTNQAREYLRQAKGLEDTLMPSERNALEQKLALLQPPAAQISSR